MAETSSPNEKVETDVQHVAIATKPPSPGRPQGARPYRVLDAWRGVASLWVVLFHVTGIIAFRDTGALAQALSRFGQYGGLGVQLFFVISGYCVVNAACASVPQPNGTLRFLVARCRRIYPPYWYASLMAIVVFLGFQFLVARGLARPNVFSEQNYLRQPFAYYFGNFTLLHVALGQASLLSVSWTLCYEIAFYMTIGLALVLLRQNLSAARLLQVLHVLTIVSLLVLVAAPGWRRYPFDLWPQFGLGIIVYDLLQAARNRLSTGLMALAAALTVAVCIKADMPVGAMNTSAHLTYLVCLGFALLLWLGYRWDETVSKWLPVRILSKVGLFSYSLYLVHTLTMRVANQGAGILHLHNPLLLLAVDTVFCLATAYAFYVLCERPFTTRKLRARLDVGGSAAARPRRIAILMPLSDLRGGAEILLYDLIKAARGRGVEWHVLFFRDGPLVEKLDEIGVPTRVLDVRRLRDPFNFGRTIARIVSYLRSERIDALISWSGHTHFYGGPAAILAKRSALWYHLAVPVPTDLTERLMVAVPADGIMTLTRQTYALQQSIKPRRPGRVVYPGVELDRFDPARLDTPAELRRKLGLPISGPLIGIVGRLQRWKGMHTLIGAMPRVLKEFPDSHCVIVGGVHEQEPDYPGVLEAQIAALGLEGKVSMVGLQRDIPEWMQAMDIVVHASDREPFGMVVIEAMALGKPIVAGSDGGPEEILPDESFGLRAPFGDSAALAAALLRYLHSPVEAEEIGRRAQLRAQDFSVKAYAENFVRSVEELLDHRAPAAASAGTAPPREVPQSALERT